MIHILYTSFQRKLRYEVYSLYFRSLPEHLQAKIFRYKRWQDAQAFFLGKVLLIECLARFGFDLTCLKELQYTENQRPFLSDRIDFNISHSGSYVICCASDKYRVGIDIEEIKPIQLNDFQDQFTGEEMYNIQQSEEPYGMFFELWSKKEAIVKADGRGLTFPIKNIAFENESEANVEGIKWYLQKIHIDGSFCTNLATNRKIDSDIQIKEMQFKYV